MTPKLQGVEVTREELGRVPIRMVGGALQLACHISARWLAFTGARFSSLQKAHLAMIDALMALAARQTVSQVKMAAEAEQMGAGAPWENALLFWVNRVRRARF